MLQTSSARAGVNEGVISATFVTCQSLVTRPVLRSRMHEWLVCNA